jgi:hypothetical protein
MPSIYDKLYTLTIVLISQSNNGPTAVQNQSNLQNYWPNPHKLINHTMRQISSTMQNMIYWTFLEGYWTAHCSYWTGEEERYTIIKK